jgi:hypothetical protein
LPIKDGFCSTSKPVKAIYALDLSEEKTVGVNLMRGVDKIKTILANIYRPQFITKEYQLRDQTKLCFSVAHSTIVKQIVRPKKQFVLKQFVDVALEDVLSI